MLNPILLAELDGSDGFVLQGDPDFPAAELSGNGNRGFYLDGGGDANGDGFADILIGGFGSPSRGGLLFGDGDAFSATIDMSSFDLPGSQGLRFNDFNGTESGFNVGVGMLGDINGDGLDDIAFGSIFEHTNAPGSVNDDGVVAVVFGSADLFGHPPITGTSLDGSDGFRANGFNTQVIGTNDAGITNEQGAGEHIVNAGDVNGDGIADFAVAASNSDPRLATDSGQAHIVFGGTAPRPAEFTLDDLNGADGFSITGVARLDGLAVRGAFGDFNGDGFSDVLAGSADANAYGIDDTGEGYLLFGGAAARTPKIYAGSLDGSDGFSIHGTGAESHLGIGLDGSGDFNGDGFDDLLIGAYTATALGRDSSGAGYIIFGHDQVTPRRFDIGTLDGSNGFEIAGHAPEDRTGREISNAGDFNGDGFDDILIGADFLDREFTSDQAAAYNVGGAFLIYGSESGTPASIDLARLDASEGLRFEGETQDDRAGVGARGVGDVNGDGFADIALGAVRADSNGYSDNGAVYVVFGRASDPRAIEGTAVSETLTGNGADNVIVAGQGNDHIRAGNGADGVHGGHGNDVLCGHAGDDRLFGDVGDDILVGSLGNDLLRGGKGADKLAIGTGADIAFGEEGNDTFFAAPDELGAGDRLFGGLGQQDILILTAAGTVDLGALDMFTGIERIKTSAAGNMVTGADSTQPTTWFGQSGADDLTGAAGRDIMRGGSGDDVLSGGLGNDILDGDSGRDTLTSGAGRDIFVLGVGEGIDTALDFENGRDRIDLQAFNFSNFAGVQTKIATVNGETAFTASGSRLFLIGVDISDLDAGDFIL